MLRPLGARGTLRLGSCITYRQSLQIQQIRHATTSSTSSPKPQARQAVTITNDTGRIAWSELSIGEKAARSTQQAFNFVVVLAGLGLTITCAAIMWSEVFSPDSKTAVFNRVVDKLRANKTANDLLVGTGPDRGKIEAHGEGSNWSRWARNRVIASNTEVDRYGATHMRMHFHVSGAAGTGITRVHTMRKANASDWETQSISLDIPGHDRVWIENAERERLEKTQGKFLGMKLR